MEAVLVTRLRRFLSAPGMECSRGAAGLILVDWDAWNMLSVALAHGSIAHHCPVVGFHLFLCCVLSSQLGRWELRVPIWLLPSRNQQGDPQPCLLPYGCHCFQGGQVPRHASLAETWSSSLTSCRAASMVRGAGLWHLMYCRTQDHK